MNHVLKYSKQEQVYCSDSYCAGHYEQKLNCSCGNWSRTASGSYGTDDKVDWLMHVVSELVAATESRPATWIQTTGV